MPADPPNAAVPPQPRLRRLPGRSPSVRTGRTEGSARLWIDERHLVQEIVKNHTQEVRRFALDDIQAVQFRQTARGLVYNIILIALLALILLIAVAIAKGGPGTTVQLTGQDLVVGSYIAAPFLVLLLINTLRGPTCRTVLTTALGPQPLPSLSRMRAARRALDEIAAGVEAIQGAWPPDEAARQVDRARTPAPAATGRTYPAYDY